MKGIGKSFGACSKQQAEKVFVKWKSTDEVEISDVNDDSCRYDNKGKASMI